MYLVMLNPGWENAIKYLDNLHLFHILTKYCFWLQRKAASYMWHNQREFGVVCSAFNYFCWALGKNQFHLICGFISSQSLCNYSANPSHSSTAPKWGGNKWYWFIRAGCKTTHHSSSWSCIWWLQLRNSGTFCTSVLCSWCRDFSLGWSYHGQSPLKIITIYNEDTIVYNLHERQQLHPWEQPA